MVKLRRKAIRGNGSQVMGKSFSGTSLSVFAAAVALSLVITPMVMGAGKAQATTETIEAPVLRTGTAPVEAASVQPETCVKKVRVVYSGYGTAPACEAR